MEKLDMEDYCDAVEHWADNCIAAFDNEIYNLKYSASECVYCQKLTKEDGRKYCSRCVFVPYCGRPFSVWRKFRNNLFDVAETGGVGPGAIMPIINAGMDVLEVIIKNPPIGNPFIRIIKRIRSFILNLLK